MATVQERLQINRTPLDKWSTREQLCLASAVSCSGDQNWMSVSRNLKLLCGNSKDSLQTRPPDWFSQKNCAVQYGHLLEDVETPKRKKRSSESSVSSSPAPVEPPTEAVLRRLAEERVQELKLEIKREQEEYAKIFSEIKAIQCGQLDDDQLLEMWSDLEKEQDMVRIEEMKMENQMRERELRKHELQRNWRTGTPIQTNSASSPSIKSSTDTTSVDMDVEEIIGSSKPNVSNAVSNTTQTAPGTSPLLSSLLKSPTPGTPVSNISTSSAHSTAPTITTLLTGGSIPNTNQPAIMSSRDDAIKLFTKPLCGPPLDSISQQQLLSPSQSAPTLSMLLEKNKNIVMNMPDTKSPDANSNAVTNVETIAASDSNNESIPMDIEEDLPAANNEQNVELQAGELDDTDANEEQQLLEVFKNIGNIDELDIDVSAVIDEEVDFLKGVDDEEAPTDDNLAMQQKLDQNIPSSEKEINSAEKDISMQTNESSTASKVSPKVEFISSDDSNDNIPLATVASSSKDIRNESSNESTFLKEQVESANPKKEIESVDLQNDFTAVAIKQEMLDDQEKSDIDKNNDDGIEEKLKQMDNGTLQDVFVMPSCTEEIKTEIHSNTEIYENTEAAIDYQDQGDIKSEAEDISETAHLSEQSENNETQLSGRTHLDSHGDLSTESTLLPKLQPPPTISIADTDENSSSTDISVQTRKDEKLSSTLRGHKQRKSPHETKTDDEMPNPSTQMPVPNSCGGNLTPRPTALRKLRDRDRSESPMIDDDATTHSDHSTTTNQRSRRRYSSTPVIDSIPNSPASSDRDESRDLRIPKKSLLSIFNAIQSSKHVTSILRIFNNELVSDTYERVCFRQTDFVNIKRNIESGTIRNVYELQRDVLLLCQNALMVTKTNSSISKIILALQQECQNVREFMPNGCDSQAKHDRDGRDTKSSGSTSSSTGGGSTSKGRSGSRKSLRLS